MEVAEEGVSFETLCDTYALGKVEKKDFYLHAQKLLENGPMSEQVICKYIGVNPNYMRKAAGGRFGYQFAYRVANTLGITLMKIYYNSDLPDPEPETDWDWVTYAMMRCVGSQASEKILHANTYNVLTKKPYIQNVKTQKLHLYNYGWLCENGFGTLKQSATDLSSGIIRRIYGKTRERKLKRKIQRFLLVNHNYMLEVCRVLGLPLNFYYPVAGLMAAENPNRLNAKYERLYGHKASVCSPFLSVAEFYSPFKTIGPEVSKVTKNYVKYEEDIAPLEGQELESLLADYIPDEARRAELQKKLQRRGVKQIREFRKPQLIHSCAPRPIYKFDPLQLLENYDNNGVGFRFGDNDEDSEDDDDQDDEDDDDQDNEDDDDQGGDDGNQEHGDQAGRDNSDQGNEEQWQEGYLEGSVLGMRSLCRNLDAALHKLHNLRAQGVQVGGLTKTAKGSYALRKGTTIIPSPSGEISWIVPTATAPEASVIELVQGSLDDALENGAPPPDETGGEMPDSDEDEIVEESSDGEDFDEIVEESSDGEDFDEIVEESSDGEPDEVLQGPTNQIPLRELIPQHTRGMGGEDIDELLGEQPKYFTPSDVCVYSVVAYIDGCISDEQTPMLEQILDVVKRQCRLMKMDTQEYNKAVFSMVMGMRWIDLQATAPELGGTPAELLIQHRPLSYILPTFFQPDFEGLTDGIKDAVDDYQTWLDENRNFNLPQPEEGEEDYPILPVVERKFQIQLISKVFFFDISCSDTVYEILEHICRFFEPDDYLDIALEIFEQIRPGYTVIRKQHGIDEFLDTVRYWIFTWNRDEDDEKPLWFFRNYLLKYYPDKSIKFLVDKVVVAFRMDESEGEAFREEMAQYTLEEQ